MNSVWSPTAECPSHGTPLPQFKPKLLLKFPGDYPAILALVKGELNTVKCPVGKEAVTVPFPVIAMNIENREIAFCKITPEEASKYVSSASKFLDLISNRRITSCQDYRELCLVVLRWLDEYLQQVSIPLFAATSGQMPDPTPLTLLAFKAQLDGLIPLKLLTSEPLSEEDQRKIFHDRYCALLDDYTQQLYRSAFHAERLAAYLSIVEKRIPLECLITDFLDRLPKRCTGWDVNLLLQGGDALGLVLRHEYINAAIHAAARQPNPRGRQWARFMVNLFLLSREPEVEIPNANQVLLTPGVLKRTVKFEDLWDAVMSAMGLSITTIHPSRQFRSQLELLGALFRHFGFEQFFREQMAAMPHRAQIPTSVTVDDILISVREVAKKTQSSGNPEAMATGLIARLLLENARREDAYKLADRAVGGALERGDQELGARLFGSFIRTFNEQMEYRLASTLGAKYIKRIVTASVLKNLRPELAVELWIELGNTCRYLHEYQVALQNYAMAKELLQFVKEPGEAAITLNQDRAIVLREMGRFAESIGLLEEAMAKMDEPSIDKARLCVTAANTYLQLNMFDKALKFSQLACSIPLLMVEPQLSIRLDALLITARAKAHSVPGEALSELSEAVALVETHPKHATRVCAFILTLAELAPLPQELILWATAQLESKTTQGLSDETITATCALASWYIHSGASDQSRALVNRMFSAVETMTERDLPWPAYYLRARLAEDSDTDARWQCMSTAFAKLSVSYPDMGVGARASWMEDKTPFQTDLIHAAKAAVRHGKASPVELLDVFEFSNGPEIGGRARKGVLDAILSKSLATQHVRFFVLVEDADWIDVVTLASPELQPVMLDVRLSTPLLANAASVFHEKIARALPGLSGSAEEALKQPLIELGRLIEGTSEPEEHICILLSPSLMGIPVHAAVRGDGSLLLERNSISVAPNLTTFGMVLERIRTRQAKSRSAIVVVCKNGDEPDFIERAGAAAQRIKDMLGTSCVLYMDLDAKKDVCVRELANVDLVVFMCHGADSGPLRGRGICLADGFHLPPSLLPAEEVPELRRFVLDTVDLEALQSVPAIVLSIACSSGRSAAGLGGTRIGLERSLFANGTQTILAPLWDVDQESALTILEDFWRLSQAHPRWNFAELHRQACLAAYRRYSDLFRWAPFSLNGSWLRGDSHE